MVKSGENMVNDNLSFAEKGSACETTSRKQWIAYLVATVFTLLLLVLHLDLIRVIGACPILIIYLIPITISAFIGGLGPGLLATAVAAVGITWLLSQPATAFSLDEPVDLIQWLVLIASGVLVSVLIEALHRSHRQLDENRNFYAVTLASIGDAVIATDEMGGVTFLNAEAERLTGWTSQAAIGEPLMVVFPTLHEETRAPMEDPVNKILHGTTLTEPTSHSLLISRDGQERFITNRAAPIRQANGTIIGVVLVFQDVTERKKLEEQLRLSQKIEALGRLAGGVAHDFNNIISIVQGYTALLATEPDIPENSKPHILEIQSATKRAANLTGQLLAFARHQPVQMHELDLNKVVADTTKILQWLLGETINLNVVYADAPLPLWTDAGALDQILLNLATNARDAMPEGGQLTIETRRVELSKTAAARLPGARAGSFVVLIVSDNGNGIAPEILPHIFEPFFTTKKSGKGTGLGLATVFNSVRNHQGWINAESRLGQGTVFSIFFPQHQEK